MVIAIVLMSQDFSDEEAADLDFEALLSPDIFTIKEEAESDAGEFACDDARSSPTSTNTSESPRLPACHTSPTDAIEHHKSNGNGVVGHDQGKRKPHNCRGAIKRIIFSVMDGPPPCMRHWNKQ